MSARKPDQVSHPPTFMGVHTSKMREQRYADQKHGSYPVFLIHVLQDTKSRLNWSSTTKSHCHSYSRMLLRILQKLRINPNTVLRLHAQYHRRENDLCTKSTIEFMLDRRCDSWRPPSTCSVYPSRYLKQGALTSPGLAGSRDRTTTWCGTVWCSQSTFTM
jgi:hypothetical protein